MTTPHAWVTVDRNREYARYAAEHKLFVLNMRDSVSMLKCDRLWPAHAPHSQMEVHITFETPAHAPGEPR